MMNRNIMFAGGGVAALLAATPALAHPGHGDRGPMEIFLNPLHKLEHLIAMVPADMWLALVALALFASVLVARGFIKLGRRMRRNV